MDAVEGHLEHQPGRHLADRAETLGRVVADPAVDPRQLLPETRTVFRYQGSLTTPPCSEGVVWNVMRRPMTDSRESMDILKQRLRTNARPPQELNGREIL